MPYYCHIFPNAQVTSNKMVHKKIHHFLATFSIPFHMVWSVLLRVVAHKTTFWLVEILWQPIRSFYSMVFEATTRNKTEHTMWKGIENCARIWCLFMCTILFEVTWVFWKMWCAILILNQSKEAPNITWLNKNHSNVISIVSN